ncbi:MAG: TIGR03862 family flavoprotein, partial [Sneathiella sp.]|nr:TIGR03862 family flavoprotein [Sneathiella sp.]
KDTEGTTMEFRVDAILYAMGGASYPHLGSDGAWVKPMTVSGVIIAPLVPSNCGFNVSWSDHFLVRFEGKPIKNIVLSCKGRSIPGDLVITKSGLEGGALYAHSKRLRHALEKTPQTIIEMDLKPKTSQAEIHQLLSVSRGKTSLSNFLRKRLHLSPVKIALLYEFADKCDLKDSASLSQAIKSVPISLTGIQDIARAISSAGGVKFENLTEKLMLKNTPGNFVAGEMLDWEAPTGGYLLQGSFATGVVAADGIADFLGVR